MRLVQILLVTTLGIISTGIAHASCYGSTSYYSCNDNEGNNYNVSKYGNSTYMNGNNSRTGSNWTQNSNTIGNSTYINGQSNGKSWNETITKNPYGTTYSGTDKDGNYYSKTCNSYGCY